MKTNNGLVVGDRVKHREPVTVSGANAVGRVVEVVNESVVIVRWPAEARSTAYARDLIRVEEKIHPTDHARARGHKLVGDPPAISSMDRMTCTECGRAVLWNDSTAYGSALEEDCK